LVIAAFPHSLSPVGYGSPALPSMSQGLAKRLPHKKKAAKSADRQKILFDFQGPAG